MFPGNRDQICLWWLGTCHPGEPSFRPAGPAEGPRPSVFSISPVPHPPGRILTPACIPLLTGSFWHISTASLVTGPWRQL